MRISDWSSDVCSSDLPPIGKRIAPQHPQHLGQQRRGGHPPDRYQQRAGPFRAIRIAIAMRSQRIEEAVERGKKHDRLCDARKAQPPGDVVGQRKEGEDQFLETRSEEHTSELQSLMRISYAVFCLKKKKKYHNKTHRN